MKTKIGKVTVRTLVGLLSVGLSWLAASSAEARVGEHEHRFRGGDMIVQGRWTERASVTVRGRRVLVFAPPSGTMAGIELRATVGPDGYVLSAALKVPRGSVQTTSCQLVGEVENVLVFAVPVDDEDEVMALVYDDVRRPCGDPPAEPVTQLGQVLAGTRPSGRMRLTGSEISARTSGRGARAMLELTVTFRGTPVPDTAAAALPPRPLARSDGAPMRPNPSRDELIAASRRLTPDLSACVSAGAPRGTGLVALELDWTGHVSNVTMPREWSTARGAGCLEAAFRKLEVPPFLRPTFTVRYPITLQ